MNALGQLKTFFRRIGYQTEDAEMKLKTGDSVVVNEGVQDPDDPGSIIAGWQGRIAKMDGDLILIDWDSITLKQMPEPMIIKCEQEGWDWQQMYLEVSDVRVANARDTVQDTSDAVDAMTRKYMWTDHGATGKRIQKVLSMAASDSEFSAFEAWHQHLSKKLKFPFKATVEELLIAGGDLKIGDVVYVQKLDDFIDDRIGVLVELKFKNSDYTFPLADLSTKEKNRQAIKDYVVWFANR